MSLFSKLLRVTPTDVPTPPSGRTYLFIDNNDNKLYAKDDGNNVTPMEGPQGPQGPQGNDGATGAQGPQGDQGPAGPGVATGGNALDILVKNSSSDYDTSWTPLFTSAPVSSGASGAAGQIAYDSNYMYICLSSNDWRRIPLESF